MFAAIFLSILLKKSHENIIYGITQNEGYMKYQKVLKSLKKITMNWNERFVVSQRSA